MIRYRIGVVLAVAAFVAGGGSPASAASTVTAVKGGAYGYLLSVSLFGGPPEVRGPAPSVTLPAAGGGPITASAPTASAVVGPATFFTSGALSVSTQGTPGPADR